MKIASDIIKAVSDNYGTHFAHWQPNKIKTAISKLDSEIANKLDYTDANFLAQSLAKELNFDITPYIVEHKYPVWIDLIGQEDIKPKNKNVVVTYVEVMKESFDESLRKIKSYADNINADFILMKGRTQGSIELEFYRLKYYLEKYDRLLFLGTNTYLKANCDNLFEVVPKDKVGIHDKSEGLGSSHSNVTSHKRKRMFLLQCDAHKRYGIMKNNVFNNLRYESELMDTTYDCSVLVCSKEHANIFKPMDFPSLHLEKECDRWVEINIYREGHDVFRLDNKYSQSTSALENIDKLIDAAHIIRYDNFTQDKNIDISWFNDNNLIGYSNKPLNDMSDFKILCLGHKEEQFNSIKDRSYLVKLNLNELKVGYKDNNSESRIYEIDFDTLFPGKEKYIGLVGASWNLKYIGLNPIDQMEKWNSLKYLNENTILCADTCLSDKFILGYRPVLKDVYPDITPDQINEFLKLVDIEPVSKESAISNQIIAYRSIVESLFSFYKSNDILDKIFFFLNKYEFAVRKEYMKGRGAGYFSETVTTLWLAHQNLTTMPQEILRNDWY